MKRTLRFLSLLLVLILCLPFCAQAEENTETDWYTERAAQLTADLYELISFERFSEYFTGSEELHAQISAWKTAMSDGAIRVTGYDMPGAALLMSMAGMEDSAMPPVVEEYLESRLGSTLISMVNAASGGSALLAASSMAIVTEGYLMPENFKSCILLHQYDGICVGVVFSQIGDGVVMGTAQFVSPMISELLNAQ